MYNSAIMCKLIISQLNIFLLLTITVAFSFRVTFDHSSALQLTIAFWISLVLLKTWSDARQLFLFGQRSEFISDRTGVSLT